MLDKLKQWFKKTEPVSVTQPEPVQVKPKKPRKPKQKKVEQPLNAKELATANNEPYINIVKVDIDTKDINNGSFELDWNDKFVLNLVRAGYKIREDDTDSQIVDRWFQTVCRNIALEIYEQEQADPEKRNDMRIIQSRDIGNGRTEVS
jgi:hypothetical protein